MKIRITADSTCDLSPELIEKYNVKIMPLFVSLGSDNMLDGIGITPQDIYDYYANTKMLPKTGARSVEDYRDFYLQTLAEGYDGIVHFVISSDMSVSYNNAAKGAEGLNVFVVDSRNLSTGIGLLVLDACDAAAAGTTAKEIAERAEKRTGAVQASFVLESLEFLYKGGRCSALAYLGANLMGIKPIILVKDGKMGVYKKLIGRYRRCVRNYVNVMHEDFVTPDKKRVFVTHTKMDDGIVDEVIEMVKSWGIFDEVLDTTAGCTVTTHCGANTIGVLFINDGGVEL